ncbi:hypothetical protein BpHYR1_010482 [Brachionus plicatilis]|uniref:Uncharacterized protein n=1 Tax=Brachionus plicatilis TaxID=10195 RepID=A0A3M7R0J5_BRAPC|nr:hypothetical protein BpHYR1_010482 [Brachionus plicatilis]
MLTYNPKSVQLKIFKESKFNLSCLIKLFFNEQNFLNLTSSKFSLLESYWNDIDHEEKFKYSSFKKNNLDMIMIIDQM